MHKAFRQGDVTDISHRSSYNPKIFNNFCLKVYKNATLSFMGSGERKLVFIVRHNEYAIKDEIYVDACPNEKKHRSCVR